MSEPLRVLIADDHPVFRSGLRALLGVEAGIEVVGEAETGAEAVAPAPASVQPDVVLMDLHMPDLDGVAATRQILHDSPHIAGAGADHVRRRRLGLRRDARRRARLPAQGRQPGRDRARRARWSARAARCSARRSRSGSSSSSPGPGRPVPLAFPQLTDREHEILDLLAQGHAERRRSPRRLRISEKTVRNHVSNIFTKLAVADRAQAIVRAREAGLGGPAPRQGRVSGRQTRYRSARPCPIEDRRIQERRPERASDQICMGPRSGRVGGSMLAPGLGSAARPDGRISPNS